MTGENMAAFITRVRRLAPRYLYGYTGAVHELANYMRNSGEAHLGVPVVWLTSSPLTDAARVAIRQMIGYEVYDQYACSEIYSIAFECRCGGGLHLHEDDRIVELLDTDALGYGRIVVTDLRNQVFPLIRYEVGDVAKFIQAPCECGVTMRRISHVQGRVSDALKLSGGVIVSGEYLTTLFDDHVDSVSQFQIRQLLSGAVEVRVVPRGDVAKARRVCAATCDRIRERSDGNQRVDFVLCESIPHDRGKFRYVVKEG